MVTYTWCWRRQDLLKLLMYLHPLSSLGAPRLKDEKVNIPARHGLWPAIKLLWTFIYSNIEKTDLACQVEMLTLICAGSQFLMWLTTVMNLREEVQYFTCGVKEKYTSRNCETFPQPRITILHTVLHLIFLKTLNYMPFLIIFN